MNSQEQAILKTIKQTITQRLHDDSTIQIMLFGSRATNQYRINSDYDIGIMGDKPIDFSSFLRIKSDLDELPILIDVVDLARSQPRFVDNVFANPYIIL